jgi:hypothetical protein
LPTSELLNAATPNLFSYPNYALSAANQLIAAILAGTDKAQETAGA